MRWAGKLGISQQTEIRPGVWEDVIIEVPAMGILEQTTEVLRGEGVLSEEGTTTSISVVMSGRNYRSSEIKYATFDGVRWQIASRVSQPPRLVMYLGEVYRGPQPSGITDDL